jgi:hypothetical protein
MEGIMAIAPDDLLPTAADCLKKITEVELEKASEYTRRQEKIAAEKKALMDKLSEPSGVSDEERQRRAAVIINRAVKNGLTEVQVGTFPNALTTDGGRAINQMESGWENTLIGLPKEIFEFWQKYLKPRGYKIKCQIIDWPGGKPGDIGITLNWE